MDYTEIASIFKALSDDKRLKIIDMLTNGTLCACKILEHFKFSQPALSQHMKVLVHCGLVRGERVENWMYYSLNNEAFEKVSKHLQSISEKILSDI